MVMVRFKGSIDFNLVETRFAKRDAALHNKMRRPYENSRQILLVIGGSIWQRGSSKHTKNQSLLLCVIL